MTLKVLGAGPTYLAGLQAERHEYLRNALIDLHPDARAARDGVRGLDEQQAFAQLLTDTVVQSTADLMDFRAADSFEAAASAAVAA